MNTKINTAQTNANDTSEVEVLYQKIANRWYAFSIVNNEVFLGSLTEQEVMEAREKGLEKFIELPESQIHGEIDVA